MLEIADIVTSYGKIEALKGVSFTVTSGQNNGVDPSVVK